jgi:hypothetical protein
MKKSMQVLAGSSAFAMLMAMVLAGLSAHGEAQANAQVQHAQGNPAKFSWQKDPIEGVWNARVYITDCSSGNPIAPAFDSMGMFGSGGTFHDTNTNNPTLRVRSDTFGYWKHVRGNKYRFAFKLFHFDVAGTYIGYDVVRHDVVLAGNGKSYTSEGGAEFFNPDGTPRPPVRGCSESTATRFK